MILDFFSKLFIDVFWFISGERPNYYDEVNTDDIDGTYATLKLPEDIAGNSPAAVSTIDDEYLELRKHSFSLVNRDKEVFVPTKVFQKAKDLLTRHHIVLIQGTPASGKTAIGLSLLRHFSTSGYAPLVLQKGLDWKNHVRLSFKQCVLLDGVVGEVRVDRARYLEWYSVFSKLQWTVKENPNCLLVIVLHSHITAHLDTMTHPDSFFLDMSSVDVDDHPLTPEEKRDMLTKHLASRKQTPTSDFMHKIITHDTSGSLFPLCCRNYVRDLSPYENTKSTNGPEVFMTPGLTCVEFFYSVLQDPDNWKDLVPVLILALNRNGSMLGKTEQTEMKLRMLGLVPIEVDMEELPTWAALFKGSVLSMDMKRFRDQNLQDGFSFALSKHQSLELLVKACDAQFLMKHVHVEPTSQTADVIIDNSPAYLPGLMQRICQEILSSNVVQMSQHPALQNSRFLQHFEAFLQQKNCLAALVSAKDCRHEMPLLYWSAWSSRGNLTCWCLDKIVTEDNRVVRRAFLLCCLFGEKVNTARMRRMFDWLCANNILKDAVSSVSLPLPAAEDQLCEEVRSRCHKAMQGSLLLTCGLAEDADPEITDPVTLPSSGREDVEDPGPPPDVASASSARTPLGRRLHDLSQTHGAAAAASQATPTRQHHPPPSAHSYFLSSSQRSSQTSTTGSYVEFREANTVLGSQLSLIAEDGENEESPDRLRHTEASLGQVGRSPLQRNRNNGFSGLSARSARSASLRSLPEGHLHSGIPVPPSIVQTSVEGEGTVIIHSLLSRWYAFLRLVSLCEVDEVNREGYTLLHNAAFSGELKLVRFLVDNGADLATLTKAGNTALTKAVDQNQVAVASYLLKEGSTALLQSNMLPVATVNRSRDLSWMLGTQSLFLILSKIVRKRRAKMMNFLFTYGIRLTEEGEIRALLREAQSVENNEAVISILRRSLDGSGESGDGDQTYSATLPVNPHAHSLFPGRPHTGPPSRPPPRVNSPVNPQQQARVNQPVNPQQQARVNQHVNPRQQARVNQPVNPQQQARVNQHVNPRQQARVNQPVNPQQQARVNQPVNPQQQARVNQPVNPQQQARVNPHVSSPTGPSPRARQDHEKKKKPFKWPF
ncbi:uncharacterized protein LOC143284602 [Babylonia areolata]|uniref:uncharacterized protein LOC143284602 n=1 Tax=Babylonia areolata TaxID=304850 RepID=UPI003FD53C1A